MNPFYLTFIFPFLFSIAVLVGVVVYFNRKSARTRISLNELARSVDGTVSRKSILTGDLLEGRHNGTAFSVRYYPGSKNSPSSLTIRLSIACPADLTIRREAWYDRIARRIGLVSELQTGDSAFDRSYFLDTDRSDIILPYLADERKRRAIDALFNFGHPARKIVFEKTGLRLVLAPFPEDAIAAFPLKQCLDEIQNLSGEMSAAGYAASFDRKLFPGGRGPVHKGGLKFIYIFQIFLIPGGIFTFAYGMGVHEPLGHSLILNALLLSAGVLLLYLLIVFSWIRGRSSSHRHYLIILILSLAGFPLALVGGALTTNGALDQGAEMSHRVRISKLYYSQNKNSRTYYVAFPSWQQTDQIENISIPYNLYRVVRPAGEIIIKTKPGYWREEWIVGIEPTETAGKPDDARDFPLRLRSIRFYEGGASAVPKEGKHFAKDFARETSRFIYCQVNMENDYWNIKDQSYHFVWRYLKDDGSLLGEVSMPFTVRSQWHTAWVSHSWGWGNPGNWPAGSYRVAVLVDGRPLGEETFLIR